MINLSSLFFLLNWLFQLCNFEQLVGYCETVWTDLMCFERMCYSLVLKVDTNLYLNLQVDIVVTARGALTTMTPPTARRGQGSEWVVKFAKLRLLARLRKTPCCSPLFLGQFRVRDVLTGVSVVTTKRGLGIWAVRRFITNFDIQFDTAVVFGIVQVFCTTNRTKV